MENEGFALQKEAGGAGLGSKYGREMWVDLQNLCTTKFSCFGFLLYLIIHQLPHTKFYQCFARSENLKIFLKMFPPAPSDFQGLKVEFSGIAVLSGWLGLVS